MPLSTAEIQRLFLSSSRFAVVGASKDQSKWGTKVLKWYLDRDMAVIPVHPKENELQGVRTVNSVTQLPDPSETGISVITPAPITLEVLKSAKDLGVRALWLQPGAENDEVKRYVSESGMSDQVILGGPCVLEEGDGILKTMLNFNGPTESKAAAQL